MPRTSVARFMTVVLVLLAQLGIAAVASAAVPPMTEARLTYHGSVQHAPAIDGMRVVYEDYRNGNWDIYLYDLATMTEKRLTASVAAQRHPAIDGTKVVWEDQRNGNWDIYLYDLTKRNTKRLNRNSADQRSPAIWGSRVVYEDYRHQRPAHGDADIYVYSLTSSTAKRLTNSNLWHYNPAIWGSHVVFEGSEDPASGWSDIYVYDLATNTKKVLTTPDPAQYAPQISGNKVVYEGNGIHVYDLGTGTETTLTTQGNSPDISGSKVVYQSDRNGNDDIYLYDLAAKKEWQLTTNGSSQVLPAISGSKVVWEDARNVNSDIYYGRLWTPKVTLSVPSVVGYGARPAILGRLTEQMGASLPGYSVALEVSRNGLDWTQVSATSTIVGGRFSALISPRLYSARYLRVNFMGSANLLSGQSVSRLVKPKALIGRPVTPRKMSHTKSYRVYGSLRPRHSAGSRVGTLLFYHRESGKWRLRKTRIVTAYNYSSYTRYKASVRLPSAGKWRMRMVHTDASHAKTYSAWRYKTVR